MYAGVIPGLRHHDVSAALGVEDYRAPDCKISGFGVTYLANK
jgi:hypothetical protein